MLRHVETLKWVAVALGLAATLALVLEWHPWPMLLSLPFCLIWIYVAWLNTEPQLKYINIVFSGLYVWGILRYFLAG